MSLRDAEYEYKSMLDNPVDGIISPSPVAILNSSVFVREMFELIDTEMEEYADDGDPDHQYFWYKGDPIVRFDGRPLPPVSERVS